MPPLQHKIPTRLVIYAKDIQNITGRKERTARKMLANIRKHYNKPVYAFVTIKEFCEYTGFKEVDIIAYLVS